MFNKTTIFTVLAVLCQKKQKARRPKLKAYLQVTVLLCLFNAPLMAQEIKPLRVGDKLPETFWTTKHQVYRNGVVSEENLMPLKGYILMIDFWASWCTNCIHRFPKVAALSEKYQAIAKVLLVNTKGNKDKLSQINAVYKRLNADGEWFNLPSIINDTLINKLLKPTFLPHYVWVSREGKVVAITNSDFVGEAPILSMHQQNLQLDSLRKRKREAKP